MIRSRLAYVRFDLAAWFAYLAALVLVLTLPTAMGSATLGDDRIRYTIRLALTLYTAALTGLLLLPSHRYEGSTSGGIVRYLWTFAWATYLVHLLMAFHYYHHWSHQHAIEHTRAVSGIGEGIYVSHLFTLLWTADVTWWWLSRRSHALRPRQVGLFLHGFMLFIVFNGTIVYERGAIRSAGILLFLWLLLVWWLRPTDRVPVPNSPSPE